MYTPDELGPFCILLDVLGVGNPNTSWIYLSAKDAYGTMHAGEKTSLVYSAQHTTWSVNSNAKLDAVLQDTLMDALESTNRVYVWSGTGQLNLELRLLESYYQLGAMGVGRSEPFFRSEQ